MSRTLRLNKKYLISAVVGSYEINRADPWWLMYRYPTLTFDQAYDRAKARYTRDHHSGHYGVPRYYRHMHGSHRMRRYEKAAVYRHLQGDSWDNHSPDSRCRGAKRFFW